MRSGFQVAVLIGVYVAGSAVRAAAQQDPLLRARQLYNDRHFESAVAAANEARTPERADAVDLIVARSFLERFRETNSQRDLEEARQRLRRITPSRLHDREQGEYLVGLGEQLYLEGAVGAAANVFDNLLQTQGVVTDGARDRILDWWATALDRQARRRADIDRQPVYQRILDQMHSELARNPASSAAAYWLSAAATAKGDQQAAWDAAFAGWVRAPLTDDQGAVLRGELDRLMLRLIVPQRARALATPPEALQEEWNDFKARWSR